MAASSASDFTLLELDSDPDPAFGVTFSGWNADGADATSAVAIHHPSVDEKRISFEYQSTTTTSYLGSSVPGGRSLSTIWRMSPPTTATITEYLYGRTRKSSCARPAPELIHARTAERGSGP